MRSLDAPSDMSIVDLNCRACFKKKFFIALSPAQAQVFFETRDVMVMGVKGPSLALYPRETLLAWWTPRRSVGSKV